MAGKRKSKIRRVAVVRCAGGSTLRSGAEGSTLPRDCGEIQKAYPDGARECKYGCLGGGSCAAACKLGAISFRGNGAAVVDPEICVGCGLCAKACPQHLIDLVPTENTIRVLCSNKDPGAAARKACPNSCIACGICEKSCTCGAMKIEENAAVILHDYCIACGMCAVKCPRGVIHDDFGIRAQSIFPEELRTDAAAKIKDEEVRS